MAAIEVIVPDIGDFKDVPVIEVLVKPGDAVKKDDSLVTLESDKATMEVPAPSSGTVKEIRVKVGDKVSQGVAILTMEARASEGRACEAHSAASSGSCPGTCSCSGTCSCPAAAALPEGVPSTGQRSIPAHASPGVRRFARELGVDVAKVTGTGPRLGS